MSPYLRIITADGKSLCGTRKAARLAAQPNAALARAAHDLIILRREAEDVASVVAQLQDTLRSYAKAIRDGDPIVIFAMERRTDEMAGMVRARAENWGQMIQRCTPGGAA